MAVRLPEALLRSLSGVPGADIDALKAAHRQTPPVSVRLNPAKPSNAFENTAPVPWCPEGRYLDFRPSFTFDPLWHAGCYYVQEASSMLLDWAVRTVLPQREALRVLDLCGAPGGKSTLLASLLPDSALLIANEVIRSRAGILEENVARWGRANTWVTCNDPAAFGKVEEYFDAIVVDAPCSGSGLFRKDEDAVAHWSEEAVLHCAARQKRILADALPALKPGGVLFYATCSYSVAEDEAMLDWLVSEQGLVPVTLEPDPAWGVVTTYSKETGACGFRCFPHLVRGEGFFLAVLRKPGVAEPTPVPRFRSLHKKEGEAALSWLQPGNWRIVAAPNNDFNAVAAQHEADAMRLQPYLYFRRLGLPVGAPAGKDWLPSHELALSVNVSDEIPKQHFPVDDALRFLKGEDPCAGNTARGWMLASFEGHALGWLKGIGSRCNNYLPKNLRIRRNLL